MTTYPRVRLRAGHDKRLRAGSPWLYSNELIIDDEAKALPAGSVVSLSDGRRTLGVAHFNPHTLVAARLLSRRNDATIDRKFFERRLQRALALRERVFEAPHYRLVHAEGDGLPGLVVDRFGDVLVLQLNTAGMEQHRDDIVDALGKLVAPQTVVLRNDSTGRSLEKLTNAVEVVRGELEGPLEVVENGITFFADCLGGQKTGWYFDQRNNRAFVAGMARGQDVLDIYAYTGGFALTSLAAGARSVLAVDRSKPALELATRTARQQKVEGFSTAAKDANTALGELAAEKRRFGLVIADPPAFAPTKKGLPQGLRAYRKLAGLCAGLVQEGGLLSIACCSHNVGRDAFLRETYAGIRASGRGGWLIHEAVAGPDHPIHPALPETGYLKFLVYALD